jgi:hypothetical protein
MIQQSSWMNAMSVNRLQPWVPFGFAAALCAITLVANVLTPATPNGARAGDPPFLCFLPMVFFFVGSQISGLLSENAALKDRISRLESAPVAGRQVP